MRLYGKRGNRAGALETFRQCRAVLLEELNAEPNPELVDLYQSILHLDTIGVQPSGVHEGLPFVGRDVEWSQMRENWLAAERESSLTIIKGETGIGKSRLAEEFAKWAQAQGFETSATRCYAAEGSIAYAPVVNWLRVPYQNNKSTMEPIRLRELARILPNILTENPEIEPPLPLTESGQRLQFFEAMAKTLLHRRTRQSVQMLLIIDDLQWCDSETLAWLHFLLRFDPSRPLLILGTYCIEEVVQQSALGQLLDRLRSEDKLNEIELTGLNQKAAASLAAQILNRPLDEPAAARLFHNTLGNPLFVMEVAQAWAAHQPELSPRLQGIIEARLARLSEK